MNLRRGKKPKLALTICIVGVLFLPILGLYAQNPAFQPPYLSRAPFPAANLWMTNPIPWNPANDLAPGSVRQTRDQYFDSLIGRRVPLTPNTAKGSGISEGVPLPNQKEIPELPARTVLIATFVSYQPILSNSGKAVYTEVTFLVNNTFEDASGRAPIGSTFVLVIPGGTVITSGGAVLSFLTQPRQYSVKVGRTYLMAMSYEATGDFFILGKDWDVTDGIVHANFSLLPKVPATLIGLSLQQLTATLNTLFGNR